MGLVKIGTEVYSHVMFTVTQAAKVTGIHRRRILRAIAAGELPAVKTGDATSAWLINEADLKQWAHEHN